MKLYHFAVAVCFVLLFGLQGVCLADEALPALDTGAVANARASDDWVIVDTRLTDAFNGWKLDGVTRGGHITGAVDFSANWLQVESETLADELREALASKGIASEKHIVLYDTNRRDAQAVAAYLKQQGYSKLYYYDMAQWAADPSLPMTAYPQYHLLVPAQVLKQLIDGERPATFEQAKQVIIAEASWGEEKTSYAKGHIPGAFHINTDRIEPPTTTEPVMWMLADDNVLADFAREFGFTKSATVIVAAEEPLSAFRVATVLRYIGVTDVRVLNGGTKAWTMAGYALETARHDPVPVADFGAVIPGNPDVIDTVTEVKQGLAAPKMFTLVDNRTWEEHIGNISGYSYHNKKGRIPGAVFGYAGKSGAYGMEYFRNPDNTMRNGQEILALWKGQGISLDTRLSFMCGSGWRAAEVYYYAQAMGLTDTGIFSDGWIGWSNTPENPVTAGVPE